MPGPAFADLPIEQQRYAVLLMGAIRDLAEAKHMSEADLRNLLFRVALSGELQRPRADELRSTLPGRLTPSLAELDPVPRATVRQAARAGALKARLLAQGAYSVAALAEGRSTTPNAVRQSLYRARRRSELFTVAHDGETLVPAFLLDDGLQPRPAAHQPVKVLRAAGEDGWALWAWFALPAAALDGKTPADLLDTEPERVAELASRRAAEAA